MPLGFPIIDHVIPFEYSTNKYVHPRSAFDNNNFEGIILGIYIDTGTSNHNIDIKEVDSIVLRGKDPVTNRPLGSRWSIINKEKQLDRKKAIKSFLPLVFKQERSLVNDWHLW
ncbi:2609_t:CDS:2 [Funneliformis mosseae]|uniref:2609_t:CDS:1 n=1 Tax=Funneliformis mosseae TaxID=27381 RepID=A0A9N9BVI1_FUNMO|nr:2609_t:CDS:2 [Funneliformis mosseae]